MVGPFQILFLTIQNNFLNYFFLKKKSVYLTLIRSPLWSLVKSEKNMLDPILDFWNLPWPWRGSLPCAEALCPVERLYALWRAHWPCGVPIGAVKGKLKWKKNEKWKIRKMKKWKNWKTPKFQNLPTKYFIRKNLCFTSRPKKWKARKNENPENEKQKNEKKEKWKIPKFQNLPTIYFIRKNLWLRKNEKSKNRKNEKMEKSKNEKSEKSLKWRI